MNPRAREAAGNFVRSGNTPPRRELILTEKSVCLTTRHLELASVKDSRFAFSFDFEYKESVRESRTRMSSSKIATKEYFLLNLESLVGILGGTVGMFTGFTFIGVSDVLVNKIFKLCK